MCAQFGHVRVKREKTTAFVVVDVDGGATGRNLLDGAAHAFGVPVDRLRLLRSGDAYIEIDEKKTLAAQEIRNDDVVCAIFQNEDGTWEKPSISVPQLVPSLRGPPVPPPPAKSSAGSADAGRKGGGSRRFGRSGGRS